MQMASFPQTRSPNNSNQSNVNSNAQDAAQNNSRFLTGWQNNPCSGLMAFGFNFPASLFGSGNENVPQPVSFNVSVQPVTASNQDSAKNVQQI